MALPNWMAYALYGNAGLDFAIFLAPTSIGVPDMIDGKFKSSEGQIKEMKRHFCNLGGFAFLLHGAVRFCAGHFQSKEMVGLAVFSYVLEAGQFAHYLMQGTAKPQTAGLAVCVLAWAATVAYCGLG
ncbi:Retrovirus-related Pol polyprotein from transposon TNT 1-94 [Durusdinium trenchii]|uniref:Retrovirus-related Pol polyprotein from transposon TNT 1-94 n=1 Tax=Durusdinium trenchii TaxID=1381693 RepID=A0ABP0HDE9_9DINO